MTGNPQGESKVPVVPKRVRVLWVLVAITVVLSLLYAVQYFVGSPVRLAVVSEIRSLALDPNNALVAVGAQDGDIRLWQIPAQARSTTGRDFDVSKEAPWPERVLSEHSAPVIEVAFTPDGVTLISVADDGEVRLWDAAGGQVLQTFSVGATALVDAAVSADGTTLAFVEKGGSVQVWDLDDQQAIQSLEPGEGDRLVLALNGDGSLVAAGEGTDIQVWNVTGGESVQVLQGYWEKPEEEEGWLGHDEEVTALAFSPDGEILASGSKDTTVLFWELESGELNADSEGHWATVTTMAFGEDSKVLLTGGKDNKSRVLRLPGGKSIAIYEGHLAAVNGTAFGLDADTLFTASADGTLRMWETANQKVVHIEWTNYGFQPSWGRVLAWWMLISGVLGAICLWGLWKLRIWSHLFTMGLYLLGPIIVLGLPLLEVLTYPLTLGLKLQIAAPLVVLSVWYVVLLYILTRDEVALFYEAPQAAPLAEQLEVSQRTVKTRFGIYSLAVWLGLLVILYSVLRRFNLDVAFMGHYFEFIMKGSFLTLGVSAASIVLAMILALLGALGRMSRNPIASGASGFYISLIRGTPLLVQIFIWYLGLPRLGLVLSPIVAGILALSVNYGAYMTEIFRAGIQAIGKGQHEAAQALGMTRGQTFRRVVLPQAFRIVIPPIGNEFIAMMKDSSLVSVMSVWELTYRAQKIGRQNFRNLETFLIAAAFYWLLTVAFQFLQGKLEEYMARSERR